MSNQQSLQKNIVYIQGKYRKYKRGISQSYWDCRRCMGKRLLSTGQICPHCQGTTKYYRPSIEDYICLPIKTLLQPESIRFHAMGKEDLDTRVLGNGRSFFLEIDAKKKVDLDYEELKKIINTNSIIDNLPQIEVFDLKTAHKQDLITQKAQTQFDHKKYQALIISAEFLSRREFDIILNQIKQNLENQQILQWIPTRIVHRKGNRFRHKTIYHIEGKYIDPIHFFFTIEVQGGTYIKELINGDNNRTNPSFSSISQIQFQCVELDLIEIFG